MSIIGLVSCSKNKKSFDCSAYDMYSESLLFRLSVKYLEKMNCETIFVLSAKHGLLSLDTIISPYDLSIYSLSKEERKLWHEKLIYQISSRCDINQDTFILMAGNEYLSSLRKTLKNTTEPLRGLGIGQRLQKLKKLG